MTARVIISRANRTRLEQARAWLGSRDAGEELIIIGATSGAAHDLARTLAKKKGAAFGWHRFTLAQLAADIAAPVLAERGVTPMTGIGAEALIARVIHRLKSEGAEGRYRDIAETPGFSRAMAGVVGELRSARVPIQSVSAAAPDLSRLLAAYTTELGELSLIDWPDVFSLAAGAVATHRLGHVPMLMLDIPIRTETELTFISALADEAPVIHATVPASDIRTLSLIRDTLQWPIEDLDSPSAGAGPRSHGALASLQLNLFKEGLTTAVPESGGESVVQVFSAPVRRPIPWPSYTC